MPPPRSATALWHRACATADRTYALGARLRGRDCVFVPVLLFVAISIATVGLAGLAPGIVAGASIGSGVYMGE